MPRNGSGLYELPYNWNDDKANGIMILASRMQNQDQDIANALTGSLASDGQTQLTGDLDFNANKAIDLADGTNTQDAVVVGQAQTGELQYYGVSSTIPLGVAGEDYELNATPTLTSYVDGLSFSFVAHVDCLDDPVLRIDTGATLGLIKEDGAGGYVNLQAGDLLQDRPYDVIYSGDVDATKFIVKNPHAPNAVLNSLTVNNLINGQVFGQRIAISNNVSDPNNDVDFSAGSSFNKTTNIGWKGSAITKRLDLTWAAGNNQGGLATGSKAADTTYHCFSLTNADGTLSDGGFDTDVNGANLLANSAVISAGFTKANIVESVITDGSGNILGFKHEGDYMLFDSKILETTATPTTLTDLTITTPAGRQVLAWVNLAGGGNAVAGTTFVVQDKLTGEERNAFGAAANQGDASDCFLFTNTSSQIGYYMSNIPVDFFFFTLGWLSTDLY